MNSSYFSGDRPVQDSGEDKLGFAAPAAHVARAIQEFASPEGFVIGLEGNWGSGKSSFVNLIIGALAGCADPPETVKFSPWLISSRDGLLSELFREIGRAALKIDFVEPPADSKGGVASFFGGGNAKQRSSREANKKKLKEALNSFSGHLSRLGRLVAVGEAFGIPYAGVAGRSLQASETAASAWSTGPSLEEEKERLKGELRKLSRQIVVFVDDLDRLEPKEAGEVVRLVRAVADFPNVVYVLCYSRSVLGQSLAHALAIDDGEGYIEKIVQATFSIPKPEDFDLRRMFRAELDRIFPAQATVGVDVESRARHQRLARVIDSEGGRTLETPRDVVRATNALRLYAGPVIEMIDLADMVWLQLIRIRNTALYEWIEGYVNNVASVSKGARMGELGIANTLRDLRGLLTAEDRNNEDSLRELARVLPGISAAPPNQQGGETWTLFANINRNALAEYVTAKRLASPQHFRYYFALSKPEGALEEGEFSAFIAAAETNATEAVDSFVMMASTPRPQGGVVAEAVLDRLVGEGINRIPEGALQGLILSLANGMDDAALQIGEGDWGRYWVWDTADSIFKAALGRLEGEARINAIQRAFSEGASLGWLTSMLRDETFAHGRYGTQRRPEEEWVFTDAELDTVTNILRERYQRTAPDRLLATPQFLSLLYAWSQTGADAEHEVRAWIAGQIESDEGLLSVLERMRSWTAINDQVIHPLRRTNLEVFMSVPDVRTRVEHLTTHSDESIRNRASVLLSAFQQGDRD